MAKTVKEPAAKATKTTEATHAKVVQQTTVKLTESVKKTFEGVLAFDKALLGIVKESITAYAHSAIEATAANTRELLNLAKAKTEEAVAPHKEVVAELKSDKKAA